jgi:hypothetical protein
MKNEYKNHAGAETPLQRLIRLLTAERPAGAVFPASAEFMNPASARYQPANVECSRFGGFGAMAAAVHRTKAEVAGC